MQHPAVRLAALALLTAAAVAACGDPSGNGRPADAAPATVEEAGERVRAILARDDRLERIAALAALLARLDPEALPAVKAAFDGTGFHPGEFELVLLLEWWARFDPEAALRWTLSEWKGEHPRLVAALFRSWAHRDPQAALARARELRNPDFHGDAILAALVGWDESGVPGVVEHVRSLPAGHERQRATRMVAQSRVVRLGVEGAIDWTEALPETGDGFKLNAMRRVASAVAEIDPARAARWAEGYLDGPLGHGLPRRVGTRWVKRDPEAALAWLATLPAGRNRDDGVQETYRDWLKRDHEAAWAWMRTQTEDRIPTWLEPAFAIYARSFSNRDPRGALEQAGRIRDDTLRETTIVVLVRWWAQRDRAAARGWIEQSDLPEDVRRRALSAPPAGRAGDPAREG